MLTFDPALQAELTYRREDIRSSFRSTRRFRTRTQAAPASASTGTRSRLPLGGAATTHRVA